MTSAMLIKILVNLVIFLLISISSGIYLYKLKLSNKGYKYLFLVYVIFWMSIMLLRPYRGTLQNAIDARFVTIALACYGLVGVFVRVFADYINFLRKNRKLFLYFAALIQVVFYIPILICPNTTSNLLQAIAIGIGASCIGSFELLFKEQYNQKKSYLTVSLLSIPPLIANFVTAPIQSIMVSSAKINGSLDLSIFKYMWVIGLFLALLSFVMLFFVRENYLFFGSLYKNTIRTKTQYSNLFTLAIIGLIITFIKFSNSDAVATLHLQKIGKFLSHDTSGYEGYLSVIFSVFQLIGGVLVGMILIKRMKSIQIFYIGIITWIIYIIFAMFNKNPIAFFLVHALNGFAYGILYNIVLGKILSFSFKTQKITPMGIYQSILAIGITCSSFYTNIIKDYFTATATSLNPDDYYYANMIVDGGLLGAIGLLSIGYTTNYFLFEKRYH